MFRIACIDDQCLSGERGGEVERWGDRKEKERQKDRKTERQRDESQSTLARHTHIHTYICSLSTIDSTYE
jgi:hypothetical protein